MDSLSNALPPSAQAAAMTGSYLDFDGLSKLKGQARTDSKAATRETAQQFEAMFLQMMMKSMRDATPKSELNESSATETFEAMFDKEVSVAMSKRNTLGLADMLVKNFEQQQASIATTAEILKQRQDPAAFNATAKGMALNPKIMGLSMDKLSDKPGGIALPKPQILPLNLPPKPISGGSGK
jgi:Rod binding domain-containing protein